MMQRKYLITKEDVNLIYDLISMPERTMSEKLDKLQKMQQFTHRLEEAEVSPWDEVIYPWEDEAIETARKEIRHE